MPYIWASINPFILPNLSYRRVLNSRLLSLRLHILLFPLLLSSFLSGAQPLSLPGPDSSRTDSLLQAGAVPHFNTIYLPNDHTSGLAKGAYSPITQIPDNDLALGRLVDHLSHSAIWNQSAIFVLEDDAQDGPDHVDAHRSPAYVISPYIRHNSVNHTMYSTTSILRTMELILGLLPMSQYDAAATPLYNCFTATPDTTAYNARPAGVDINTRNTPSTPSAVLSSHFDLSKADAVPDALLNEVLWKAIKGENSPAPKPRRSAFVKVSAEKDKE